MTYYPVTIPPQQVYVQAARQEGGVSTHTAIATYENFIENLHSETNGRVHRDKDNLAREYDLTWAQALDVHDMIMEENTVSPPAGHFVRALIRAGFDGPEEIFPGLKDIRAALGRNPDAEISVPHWPFLSEADEPQKPAHFEYI